MLIDTQAILTVARFAIRTFVAAIANNDKLKFSIERHVTI